MEIQHFGPDPIAVRKSDHFEKEYVGEFAKKWDQLIDWNRRAESENGFFSKVLQSYGARKILDVATGTGFHSVQLLKSNFDVISVDGSAAMIAQAFQNALDEGLILKTTQADWRFLERDLNGKFDAIICLGNSFTHLFSERDRRRALAEYYAMLNHDGVLILDQRNYDALLDDDGYKSTHTYYYCGKDVSAGPVHIDAGLARFEYRFPDGSNFYLNMFPLRKNYTRRLMHEVGFQNIKTYGDFQETYKDSDPDFFIHVAEKKFDPLAEEEFTEEVNAG